MADTWITPTRKKDLLGYIDQLKKLSGGPVEEEDLYAAGFSERDLEDVDWFAPREPASTMMGDGSKAEAYTPTSRDNVRANVMGGLQGLGLDKQLARSVAVKVAGEENPADGGLGMGLADFTPLGALFGAEEGAGAVKRGVNSGDYTSAGLGALEAATSVASAIPGGKIISQGVNKLAEKLAGQYDPSVVRTFFGPTSAKADIPRLREAEEMAAGGQYSEEEVWRKTGWWNGPNGWRFEVDDSKLELPLGSSEMDMHGKNRDAIVHKDFWDAMSPRDDLSDADFVEQETAKFKVRDGGISLGPMNAGKKYKGSFEPYDKSIKAYGYTSDDQKSTLVHEMQHAIQNVLGDKGVGVNPDWIKQEFRATLGSFPKELQDAAKVSVELGYSKTRLAQITEAVSGIEERLAKNPFTKVAEQGLPEADPSSLWEESLQYGDDKTFLNKLFAEKDRLERSLATKSKILGHAAKNNPDFSQAISEFELVGKGIGEQWFSANPNLKADLMVGQSVIDPSTGELNDFAAHTLYSLDAGEVEARVAGDRANWSPKERAYYPPATDVKDKDTVYTADDLINWFRAVKEDATKTKKGYAKGGVVQEVDPVSGNEVPPGAEPVEVRDDIDAKLSDGEYVIPADVVRYIGLDKIEKLILQAKEGLSEMDKNGRIGGEEVVEEDDLPFSDEELSGLLPEGEAPMHMAIGGLVSAGDRIRNGVMTPTPTTPTTGAPGILPPWMMDQGQTPEVKPVDNGSWADRQAEKTPMGMAGAVETWKAKDFSSAVKQRSGDPGTAVIEKIVSTIPLGGLAMRARNKYLDKKVPGAIDNMIKSGKDIDGTPLTAQQISELQAAKTGFVETAGYKPGGLGGLVKSTIKSIIKPKDKAVEKKTETKKSEPSKTNKTESAADKRAQSSTTSSKSSSSKTSTSSGSKSSSSKSSSTKK